MYHSCSPLPARVEPAPLGSSYQNVVDQVPPLPFHRLSELNSSSNVMCAVAARLVASIDIPRPFLVGNAPPLPVFAGIFYGLIQRNVGLMMQNTCFLP